jgi:DNA invertase Pin-like site-specific DNA recombinase
MARLRALGICRVSTAEQARDTHFSLGHQRRVIAEYCARQGWELVDAVEYVQSGGSNQTELAQILSRVQGEHMHVVVVAELDRLARDMVTTLTFIETLQAQHVGFVSVADQLDLTTPEGELRMMMLSMFAHYFRRQLSHKVRGGQEERFRAGKRHGERPYGYRAAGDTWAIDPEEAAVVRQVYRWYLDDDLGQRAIAKRLNAMGIKTQRGRIGAWDARTIGNMLRREAYCGDTIYQKWRYTRDRRGHLHQTIQTPSIRRDTHPAIIDRRNWERVQARMRDKAHLGPRGQKVARIFSGLCRCGVCGTSMSINRGHYVCRGYITKGTCSRATAIPQTVLEQRVLEALTSLAHAVVRPEDCAVWIPYDGEWQRWLLGRQQAARERERIAERLRHAQDALLEGTLTGAEYREIATRLRQDDAALARFDVPLPESCQTSVHQAIQALMVEIQAAQAGQAVLTTRQHVQQVCRQIVVAPDGSIAVSWGTTHPTPSLLPFGPPATSVPTASGWPPAFPAQPVG